MPGGGHPVSREIEKLVAQLKICGQPGQAHAVARILDAFVIGSHHSAPFALTKGLSATVAWDQSRYWMVHLIRERHASMFASRLTPDNFVPLTNGPLCV